MTVRLTYYNTRPIGLDQVAMLRLFIFIDFKLKHYFPWTANFSRLSKDLINMQCVYFVQHPQYVASDLKTVFGNQCKMHTLNDTMHHDIWNV